MGGWPKLLTDPFGNRFLQLVEVAGEEVLSVGDDNQLRRRILFQFSDQSTQPRYIAKLIPVAMHKKDWLAASQQETEIVFVDRGADADQVANTFV